MMGDGSFKIVIGNSLCGGSFEKSDVNLASDEIERFDPAEARGALDLCVDGQSLNSRSNEDSVFFLMRDLLSAAQRLSGGDSTARVSFYESPHELVLQRIGQKVYITFFRGGQLPEVMAKDQVVDFRQFLDGVIDSAKELHQKALDLSPSAAADPLITWMNDATERLEGLAEDLDAEEGEPASRTMNYAKVESSRFKTPRNADGFSLGFKFLASETDLLAPGRPLGNDLNALLFRGQFAVHARGKRRVLGEGYLFLQTEKLIAAVRKVLSAWEEGRPMSVRLISEGLVVGVKLGGDDSFVLTMMDRVNEESILVLNDLTPWEFSDAILGAAREVRRLVVAQSPMQRRNIRLESFSTEIRALSAWAKEQRRGALINEDVDRYRRVADDFKSEEAEKAIQSASRLAFSERWRIEAEGLEMSGTMLCGDTAVISARGFMLGVEAETGAVLWRRETDRSESRLQIAGKDSIVRVAPSGTIDLIDLKVGVLRWRTTLAPRSGGSPVVLTVDHGPVPGLVIVAEEERKLVALDLRTGEPRWRFTAPRGGRFALRRHGQLLYVASSDSQLCAVDLKDGSLVWRFPDRTKFHLPPAIEGDTLIIPGGRYGKQEGRLYALDAFSGEQKWDVSLNGGALTSPILANGVAMLPVRTGKRNDLAAFDTKTGELLWKAPCDGWADSCALMALDKSFIVNVAGGTLLSLDARTGDELWSTVLGPSCSDDIPINLKISLRGGVLFVPADTIYVVRPDDGHVIHSLGGDPPVPDMLQVDPSCAVFLAEESGHIAMYELTRRLSVVRSI